jgi:AraC family transcriptional activator of mtrCDE
MDVVTDWVRTCGTSGVLLARSRLPAPWGMALETRPEAMFHIVLEGSCFLRGADSPTLQLFQGDLVLLPHGHAHDIVHRPNGRAEPLSRLLERQPLPETGTGGTTVACGAYRSDTNLAHPMLRALPPVVHYSASRVRANPALAATLSLVTAELEQPGPGTESLVQHLFDALFVYVLRTWSAESAGDQPGFMNALKDASLSKALSRMHAEPESPWTVARLAREASLSRAAFARRFTENVGEAPLAYLTRWRMGVAARLLRTTKEPVAEIATRVGYESEFAFSRAFKRTRGVAPTLFRRSATAVV